jgi:hypothetical protein
MSPIKLIQSNLGNADERRRVWSMPVQCHEKIQKGRERERERERELSIGPSKTSPYKVRGDDTGLRTKINSPRREILRVVT